MEFLKKVWSEDDGQGLVEYGLLVALIVVVVVAALTIFKGTLSTLFNKIGTSIGAANLS